MTPILSAKMSNNLRLRSPIRIWAALALRHNERTLWAPLNWVALTKALVISYGSLWDFMAKSRGHRSKLICSCSSKSVICRMILRLMSRVFWLFAVYFSAKSFIFGKILRLLWEWNYEEKVCWLFVADFSSEFVICGMILRLLEDSEMMSYK